MKKARLHLMRLPKNFVNKPPWGIMIYKIMMPQISSGQKLKLQAPDSTIERVQKIYKR